MRANARGWRSQPLRAEEGVRKHAIFANEYKFSGVKCEAGRPTTLDDHYI